MKKFRELTFISFLSFTVFTLNAQSHINLDSVRVSANRIPGNPAESGKNVTVITEAEIRSMPINSVDELLRFTTGINLNSRSAFGVQTDIGMRGSTFSQVLILVDNMRLNDPLTAHFNNNIPIPLSEVGQIEIIRGPASVSFGPDAVGGVIHIKTKSYLARQDQKTDFKAQGMAGVGENQLFLTDIGVSSHISKLHLSAAVKTSVAQGQQLENPNLNIAPGSDSLYNNYFDLRTYTAAATYFFNDEWQLYGRVGIDRRDFNAKYFYTASNFDESTELTESLWSQLHLTRNSAKNSTEFSLGYKKTDDLFVFNPAFTPNEHTTQQFIFNANHSQSITKKTKIAYGLQLGQRDIISTDRGDHQNIYSGVYGILYYRLFPDLITTTGLRLDYDDNFGLQFLPQLSLAYIKDNYTLRSSMGRSIRAADFTERFVSYNLVNPSAGRNIGNPDLKAESSYTFDLGADYRPVKSMALSATVFYRFSENLIDYIITNSNDITNVQDLLPDAEYLYASNISSSNTHGLELQLDKDFKLSETTQLRTGIGYTYLSTQNADSAVSKYIANHPDHILNGLFKLSSKYVDISLAMNYIHRNAETIENIDARVRSDYMVTNLLLHLKPGNNKMSLFMNIHNLFDVEYQEILGPQMPGRWVMGGLKWQL